MQLAPPVPQAISDVPSTQLPDRVQQPSGHVVASHADEEPLIGWGSDKLTAGGG